MNFPTSPGGVAQPTLHIENATWRSRALAAGHRIVAEETAVALSYNYSCHAVMMATPLDLADFAIGFGLTEGIIESPSQIEHLEIQTSELGIELQASISKAQGDALTARRRWLAGPTGCGLCGVDSLQAAARPPRKVLSDIRVSADSIAAAVGAVPAHQSIHAMTRAVHAAGFWLPGRGLITVREDVGRHNALDKLAGAIALSPYHAEEGLVVLTSRVSVEMVQKAATMGTAIIAAVSAPTALAVRACAAAGITLVAVARSDGFEIFTHGDRIEA